jgi:hypothetical protein
MLEIIFQIENPSIKTYIVDYMNVQVVSPTQLKEK